ncbi:MAG: two-component regulator propeller domain-containing protein [Bacteroidota bacterium]
MCRLLLLLVGMMIAWAPIWSQGSGEWKNYTAQNNVRSISAIKGNVWAATQGGVFCYRIADSTCQQFTNSEGLPTNDVTCVIADDNGGVWTGDATGGIAHYNPGNGQWQVNLDITNSSFLKKQINAFLLYGDSLFIAGDYGVSLFYKRTLEFRDSYVRFGNFSALNKVNGLMILRDNIWIATAIGAATASLSSSNLISPTAWRTYTSSNGLPSDSVKTIFSLDSIVYVGTDRGVAYFNGTTWTIMDALGPLSIQHAVVGTNGVYAITKDAIYLIQSPTQFQKIVDVPADILTDITMENGKIILGSGSRGIGFVEDMGIRYTIPNGPASNQFISLAIDQKGILWAASGYNLQGKGFYSFDGKTWTNYTTNTDTLIKSDDYHRVVVGVNNTKWICSWGDGMMMVRDDNTLYRYSSQNAPFLGIKKDPKYILICDVAYDWKGNTWFVDWDPADEKLLWVLRPDSTWRGYPIGYNQTYTDLSGISIDQNGNKWLYQRLATVLSPGLFFVDSKGTLDDPSDDTWTLLTTSSGLVSNNITTVAVDNDGSIWVGTTSGANVILNPSNPEASLDKSIVIPLEGINVNTIAVDPLNNKWIGTKEGIFVLSDRASVVASYTVNSTNGKLPDNDVRSIAFDGNRGIAYLGTEKGLASVRTSFIAPQPLFQDLLFYPNPFIISTGKTLTIDGLVQNSSVKILSNDGRLVRELSDKNSLPGGRVAFWDGTDQQGAQVASGIYLVVAYTQQGDQVATGKVAVVRR